MKSRWMASWLVAFTLIGLLGVGSANAQDCAIDVQPVVTLLADAEAAAAQGDNAAALAAISQAQAELQAIQDACAQTVTPPGVTLSEMFQQAEWGFNVSYPAGWLTDDFREPMSTYDKNGRATPGRGGSLIIANSESSMTFIQTPPGELQLEKDGQAALVASGSASQILYAIGIYDVDQPPTDDLGLPGLVQLMIETLKEADLFTSIGEPSYSAIDGQKIAQLQLDHPDFEALLLLRQLPDNQFALTLGVGNREASVPLASLMTAINLSIQLD